MKSDIIFIMIGQVCNITFFVKKVRIKERFPTEPKIMMTEYATIKQVRVTDPSLTNLFLKNCKNDNDHL